MSLTTIKSTQIDYIVVFLMVVMSAGASFLGEPVFRLFLLFTVFGVIVLRRKSIKLRNFKFLLLFYVIWAASVFLYFDINFLATGQLFTYLSFFTLVIASYYATVALNDFFKTYVKVIYHLAIISFFFFAIQIVNVDLLISIVRSFDGITSLFKDDVTRPSIILYTYAVDSDIIFRNYGFATEPGEFSVFLILALMLQVSFNEFKIDRIVIILIVAILSTTSTAGYIGLILFIIYVLMNKKFTYSKLWFSILAIPAILIITNQEFVSEKVSEAWERESISYVEAHQERITPGRIGSLLLDIEDFKKNPIIGYGVHQETRYINYGGVEQQRTNGVTDYLVKFGIFGFIIMLYNFHRTFMLTGIADTNRNAIILISSILAVAFAQVILATPIFLALQFYHFQSKT